MIDRQVEDRVALWHQRPRTLPHLHLPPLQTQLHSYNVWREVYMCGNMQPPHPQPTQLNSCTCTHTYDNLHTHSYTHVPIHLSQAHTHLPIHLLQAHIHLPRHNHPTPRIACWSVTMSIFLPHLTRMHTHPMCNHEKINQPQLYKKDFLDQELLK